MTSSIKRFNLLIQEVNAAYHTISRKLDMTDSAFTVIYIMYENGGSCPLNEIIKTTGISKQTVNSALRRLEADESVYLERAGGNSKTVHFTEKGRELAEATVRKIRDEENAVFDSWTETEREMYFRLTERYAEQMKEIAGKL